MSNKTRHPDLPFSADDSFPAGFHYLPSFLNLSAHALIMEDYRRQNLRMVRLSRFGARTFRNFAAPKLPPILPSRM
jgi:hypothetical protein